MLEKLVFKLGDREIELTKLEAMQLQGELNSLFGYPSVPASWPPWYIPITYETQPLPPQPQYYTTGTVVISQHMIDDDIYSMQNPLQ